MDAQAGANTPGWLHHLATQFGQASTDVLEKKMTAQERSEANASSLESLGIAPGANADPANKTWPIGDTYTHPDGTVFTRSVWGNWYGTDGSEVSDPYITFRRSQAGL